MKRPIEALPEAQITGQDEKLFICDADGNRYYYNTEKIAHSYVQRLGNGKSRCYFGFDTFAIVPIETDTGLMQIETEVEPVRIEEVEDPF